MKIQNWNGHNIRFVEKDGEWWAVLKDVCGALGLTPKFVKQRLEKEVVSNNPLETAGGSQQMLIVNEFGIYQTIFQSRKREAKDFQKWTYTMLKTLREQTGLEGFEIFRMLDREHQKEMMKQLRDGLKAPVRVDFIKANTISNKAISTKYGLPKMVKKASMTPQMLKDRERVLEDTVELMKVKEKYDINNLSVSDKIYQIYN